MEKTNLRFLAVALSFLLAPVGVACGPTNPGDDDPTAEDIDGPDLEPGGKLDPTSPPDADGKEDSTTRKGLYVNTNTKATQVWTAKNKWEDRDTEAARASGIAWGENSGLNWDEKYVLWMESMPKTRGVNGWYNTFMLKTPWGKEVPAPALECAEVAMFLRATFASWYNLPFFMEGVDRQGRRLFVGHFGIRTLSGNAGKNFAQLYKDHSNLSAEEALADWPQDETLRAKGLYGDDDVQNMIAEGARFGAYADEIFLNKRVGHWLINLLDYFGSASLVDGMNTYNLVPEALRAGDVLLERWQRSGIGHTLPLKHVEKTGDDRWDAQLASGSMPRRQPKWDDGESSKYYFTSEYTGGEGSDQTGYPYAKMGGGLKRWRVTKNIGGYWNNTLMDADKGSYINSTDYAKIAARPARFAEILGSPDPESIRAGLLRQITDQRTHLSNYPASCSARERREQAFAKLYEVNSESFGISKQETDRTYRTVADYIFADLEYTKSKTCCWNSTTADMYKIIMDYNQAVAESSAQCKKPVVFKASGNGGYDAFAAYAAQTGRADQWKPWTEDEPCSQRGVSEDTEKPLNATPWCSLQ